MMLRNVEPTSLKHFLRAYAAVRDKQGLIDDAMWYASERSRGFHAAHGLCQHKLTHALSHTIPTGPCVWCVCKLEHRHCRACFCRLMYCSPVQCAYKLGRRIRSQQVARVQQLHLNLPRFNRPAVLVQDVAGSLDSDSFRQPKNAISMFI